MAQHDYNFANQTGLEFRSDLNNAMQAIVTDNSGSTAPNTTFAGMIWRDTSVSPSIKKRRNDSNTAWVVELTAEGEYLTGATSLSVQRGYLGVNDSSDHAVATGTSDTLLADFSPVLNSTNKTTIFVKISSTNTTTTPTLSADGDAGLTIVKGNNQALAVGDMPANSWGIFQKDVTLNKWVLLNPATGVSSTQQATKQIQPISATVSSNSITISLNPVSLDFRSPTLSNGAINTRTVSSTISLVVPSGATLGTTNSVAARLVVLAMDNAGSVELAVFNSSGSLLVSEDSLVNTNAISGSSNSNSAVYSTTSRSNLPLRVVGYIDITETTAGIWATAPTLVQGYGGKLSLDQLPIGMNQTYQNVAGSRAIGTTYYNTTGRTILVSFGASANTATNSTIQINGTTIGKFCNYGVPGGCQFLVPSGSNYSINGSGLAVGEWFELR